MIPRSPSPVQCVRIFAVLVLLAAAAGMTSGAGLSSSSTSSSSSPTQQVPTNRIPNNLYGDTKESRHHIAGANRAAGARVLPAVSRSLPATHDTVI
jgi:hypothetical protein